MQLSYFIGVCNMLRQQRSKESCCGQILSCPTSSYLLSPAGEDGSEAATRQLAEREPPAGQCWHNCFRLQQQKQAFFQVKPVVNTDYWFFLSLEHWLVTLMT